MKVLVIDVGGTFVKLMATGEPKSRKFASGQELTPSDLVKKVRAETSDWDYEVIAIGYPGFVGHDGPEEDPGNLGKGWVGFDFEKAFEKPFRLANDAVMQALGGYQGGRMLFVGLGTGLGSALVCDRVVIPLELGAIRCDDDEILSERLGKRGLERFGEDLWKSHVVEAIEMLRLSMRADYVVLGGGNSERFEKLPEHVRRGGNDDAFEGGFRLWEEAVEPHDVEPSRCWRVVR